MSVSVNPDVRNRYALRCYELFLMGILLVILSVIFLLLRYDKSWTLRFRASLYSTRALAVVIC